MNRLFFFLILGVVIYFLLKSYRKPPPQEGAPTAEDFNKKAATQGEDMVRCALCGVHLPMQESILASGNYYCSEAHRREHSGKSA